MESRILIQGQFDGFCLLYSVMNSYKSLVKPRMKATTFVANYYNLWNKLINITPSLHNFASGKGSDFGVARNKTDIEITQRLISSCFSVVTEEMKIKVKSTPFDTSSIIDNDFSESVLILCVYQDTLLEYGPIGDHWITVVGVDADQSRLLVSCSYTPHDYQSVERTDPVTNRAYNNTLELSQITSGNLYKNSVQRVSVESAQQTVQE